MLLDRREVALAFAAPKVAPVESAHHVMPAPVQPDGHARHLHRAAARHARMRRKVQNAQLAARSSMRVLDVPCKPVSCVTLISPPFSESLRGALGGVAIDLIINVIAHLHALLFKALRVREAFSMAACSFSFFVTTWPQP
jgi:hypothetical protein